MQSTPYPVQFSVDYPDRPLHRGTTALRLVLVIPIIVVLGFVSGATWENSSGRTVVVGAGGLLVIGPLLMILFRRVYPRGMSPTTVAGFMMFNEGFPRSVVMCVRQIDGLLTRLKSRYTLRGGSEAMEKVDELLGALLARPIEEVIQVGLHEYLDWVQGQLCGITNEIGRAFFGQSVVPMTQSQSQ